MYRLLSGIALGTLLVATPALAEPANSAAKVAPGQTTEGAGNSGPGVQGAPDTRTGPSTKGEAGDASSGASTGTGDNPDATTSPSQDSSGVEGLPGNKSGSSTAPADGSAAPAKKY